jgi:hypothetical protein
MTYTRQAKEIPTEVLQALLQQYGSIKAVVEHITGGKAHERVRAILSERVKTEGLGGLRREHISTRYTPDQLIDVFAVAGCWSDIYRSLGLTICDHNKASIKRFAEHHNIEVPEFTKEQLAQAFRRGGKRCGVADDEIFVAGSKFPRQSLRKAVIRKGIVLGNGYVCSKCGQLPVWDNEPLTLELDHINGTSNDNRLENLRWLCPNCHTQTPTHKGKNRK